MNRISIAFSMFLGIVSFFAQEHLSAGVDDAWRTVINLDFNDGKLGPWRVSQDAAFALKLIDGKLAGGSGPWTLEIARSAKEKTASISLPLPFPASKALRHGTLKLNYRTDGYADSDLKVYMIQNSKPRVSYVLMEGDRSNMQLKASKEWREELVPFELYPETTSVTLFLDLADKSKMDGVILLSALEIKCDERPFHLESAAQGNVFAANSGIMELHVPCAESVQSGKIDVLDEEGRSIGALPIAKGQRIIQFDVQKGYSKIRCEAEYEDGSKIKCEGDAAAVGSRLPDATRLKSSIGSVPVFAPNDMVLDSATSWFRDSVNIHLLEKTASGFAIPESQKPWVNLRKDGSMNWIFCVVMGKLPAWLLENHGAKGGNVLRPKDWEEFGRLMRWVATQMSGCEYVEVANEPDVAEMRGETDMETLVKLHDSVADAFHEVNQKVKVLGPCFCSIQPWNFPRFMKFCEKGGLEKLDGVVMHPYASVPEGDFINNVIELKKHLASIGRGSMPIFFTEYGWETVPGAGGALTLVDELTQARYCVRSSVLLLAEKTTAFTYFSMFVNGNGRANSPTMLRSDRSPKPVYPAFANMARWLADIDKADSKWLRSSPTSIMAIFPRGEDSILVLWDTESKKLLSFNQALRFAKAEDMMGREVLLQNSSMEISPSPIFVELKGSSLKDIEELPPVKLLVGNSCAMPWGEFLFPAFFKRDGNKLSAPLDMAPGRYVILGKGPKRFQLQPIIVETPFEIASLEYSPVKNAFITKLSSLSVKTASASLRLKLKDGEELYAGMVELPASALLELELPTRRLEFGRHYTGELDMEAGDGAHKYPSKRNFDITPVVSVACSSFSSGLWSSLPSVEFSKWRPFATGGPADVRACKPEDCSSKMMSCHDAKALHLLIEVRDNVHRQTQAPGEMWKEDSIQLGFDVDRDQAWRPNSMTYNNGHRTMEYTFGLKDGKSVAWRSLSASDLPGACVEPKIDAKITREGDLTRYELAFPWETLSLQAKPEDGTSIGFAILVNDSDSPGERHGLRLFNGIIGAKEPADYGPLYLVPAKP